MYCNFYGLNQKPFELAPVGGLVYFSEAHREAIATLRYGVIADKGFLLLTGGVGSGKTTLLNTLLGMLKDKVQVCVLNNPKLKRNEFFCYLGGKIGLDYNGNKGQFLLKFSDLLVKHKKEGSKLLLIIDEAQVFSIDLFEEIRLLSNLAEDQNVLGIFLIGQPELQEKLADPILLPLRQRIGIRYHLEPLNRDDTGQYILYRLNKAGAANPALFTTEAIDCIFEASMGNPRLINVICDHAMISGFTSEKNKIDRDIIVDCIKVIRLQGEERLQISELLEKTVTAPVVRNRARKSLPAAVFALVALILATSGSLLYFFPLLKWFP